MNLIKISVVTLLVAVPILALTAALFQKYKLLDNPKKFGFEREPVPYSLGIALILTFIILGSIFLPLNLQTITIYLAVAVLGVTCFLDDHFKLKPILRLLIQFLAAGLVVWGGTKVQYLSNPFSSGLIDLGLIGILISVVWIVTLTNLMNFLDGVSGLSSGVSSVGFLILFSLSVLPSLHQIDQSLSLGMSLILFILAFLAFVFEFPSPKILIADSGTMFFGFMLAVVSMISGGKLATAGLVLLIPLFDGLWVISRRIFNRKSPFEGDLDHLHHRLLRIGLSYQHILFIYMFVSLVFGLIAVFVWNTLFKLLSLLLLLTALAVIGYLVWTKEKK